MNRFLIVDGSSMLVTSYYGLLPKQILFEKDEEKKKKYYDKIMQYNGLYTNAMYAMTKTLKKIEKEQQITHMVICFDMSRDTFRRKQYEGYKAQRSATPEPLKSQFVQMEDMLKEIGYAVEFCEDYEADDLAGSAAALYSKEMPTYIITKDHDYLQLVDKSCTLWLLQTNQDKADAVNNRYSALFSDGKGFLVPDKAAQITPAVCRAEFGVAPEQIPDLKGIVGDTSDNIPGVKGVSSAAVPLLREYSTLSAIYDAIDSCPDEKSEKKLSAFWKEKLGVKRSPLKALKQYREEAFMSEDLATIRRDVKLRHDLDQMSLERLDDKKRREQYQKYGFRSL
ncbi:MAG: 5'-3' exonuclease [Lachnospiraceae bacterium]|uniref:5'-3' exonuclease n=1 Tax=Candidatus Weimeria bifida TaxID=2599074 RepID=A0A6N7IZV3_9FIRM|nr:5'-3' exonuclease [Candidatus Weimeria bifida]RRF95441.1 MAG: 5'-3' exonuclease [Lachnospiraceae bacterium]